MPGYIGLNDKSSGKIGTRPDAKEDDSVFKNHALLKQMKQDLIFAEEDCSNRGLFHSSKWDGEMLISLNDIELDEVVNSISLQQRLGEDYASFVFAKSCFGLNEYDRAAYFTENSSRPLIQFFHFYSRYMSGEKKKNEDTLDPLSSVDLHNSPHLKELHSEMTLLYSQPKDNTKDDPENGLDGWQMWLYGVVLKRLDLKKEAMGILCQAIHMVPTHWGAWLELASLVTSKEVFDTLKLPTAHWMYRFFTGHVYLELNMNEEASAIYSDLEKAGLRESSYIKAQTALVAHNFKDIDKAICLFKDLESSDRFRLENVDIYSNLLFVKEMRVELAHLAHRVAEVDKYKVETCCVVGNYYSLRGQHEKSIQYFQRALRLNPHYLSGWTLMGHEYMEVKNTNAAIQCYRQAIEVKRTDYRAWYGLGQTYEVLKLYAYSIYYYKQAYKLHPNDSRTLIAMGDCYEKLEKWTEAKKCYHKARSIGDVEDLALLRLARLYSQLSEGEKAAAVYERFLRETDDQCSTEDRGQAYLFLAEHYLQKNFFNHAYEFAHKCTLYPETRDNGKTILNEIANKRQTDDDKCDDSMADLSPRSPLFQLDPELPSTSRLPHLSFSP